MKVQGNHIVIVDRVRALSYRVSTTYGGHLSYSLNSLKGGYTGDYLGDGYKAY